MLKYCDLCNNRKDMKLDRDWFEHMIETAPWKPRAGQAKTKRQFAIQLFEAKSPEEDFSAAGFLSRILNGERKLSVDEVIRIAGLFDVSVIEVLKHLGYKLDDEGYPKK